MNWMDDKEKRESYKVVLGFEIWWKSTFNFLRGKTIYRKSKNIFYSLETLSCLCDQWRDSIDFTLYCLACWLLCFPKRYKWINSNFNSNFKNQTELWLKRVEGRLSFCKKLLSQQQRQQQQRRRMNLFSNFYEEI